MDLFLYQNVRDGPCETMDDGDKGHARTRSGGSEKGHGEASHKEDDLHEAEHGEGHDSWRLGSIPVWVRGGRRGWEWTSGMRSF